MTNVQRFSGVFFLPLVASVHSAVLAARRVWQYGSSIALAQTRGRNSSFAHADQNRRASSSSLANLTIVSELTSRLCLLVLPTKTFVPELNTFQDGIRKQ